MIFGEWRFTKEKIPLGTKCKFHSYSVACSDRLVWFYLRSRLWSHSIPRASPWRPLKFGSSSLVNWTSSILILTKNDWGSELSWRLKLNFISSNWHSYSFEWLSSSQSQSEDSYLRVLLFSRRFSPVVLDPWPRSVQHTQIWRCKNNACKSIILHVPKLCK